MGVSNANIDVAISTRAAAANYTAGRAALLDQIGIKSMQRGQASLASTSLNVTVAAVNMSKALLIITNTTAASSANAGELMRASFVTGHLTTTTNIALTRSFQDGTANVTWQLIEFN